VSAGQAREGALVGVVLLWLLMVISALLVVGVTQDVRERTSELEVLRREAAELEVQWGQYLLEQSTWASYARVEKIAREELEMLEPGSEQIIFVNKEP